jgi:cephalosporin hydroxylase
MTASLQSVQSEFAKLVYRSAWATTYRGVPMVKQPADLWAYQEIVCELRPELIIEAGTWQGGTALFLADLCSMLERGHVVSIDLRNEACNAAKRHKRISLRLENSLETVWELAGVAPVLVILDSGHSREHVAAELEHFAPLVTPGSYLIVEDTNIHGNPIEDFSGDPAGAVVEFLTRHPEFEADRAREKWGITQNPGGYLRRRV